MKLEDHADAAVELPSRLATQYLARSERHVVDRNSAFRDRIESRDRAQDRRLS
jgi:hypothetical protein